MGLKPFLKIHNHIQLETGESITLNFASGCKISYLNHQVFVTQMTFWDSSAFYSWSQRPVYCWCLGA